MTDTTSSLNALREAAQAVIDRWDGPGWKDLPATADYIHRLRKAMGDAPAHQHKAGKDTNQPVSIHLPEQCKQTDTLNDCPFCGQPPQTNKYGGYPYGFTVECKGCDATQGYHGSPELAKEAWNARTVASSEIRVVDDEAAIQVLIDNFKAPQQPAEVIKLTGKEIMYNHMKAAYLALKSTKREDSCVWQPIANVPKNGSIILLCNFKPAKHKGHADHYSIFQAYWDDEHDAFVDYVDGDTMMESHFTHWRVPPASPVNLIEGEKSNVK